MDRWYVRVSKGSDGRISLGRVKHHSPGCRTIEGVHRGNTYEIEGGVADLLPECKMCKEDKPIVHSLNVWNFVRDLYRLALRHSNGDGTIYLSQVYMRRLQILNEEGIRNGYQSAPGGTNVRKGEKESGS